MTDAEILEYKAGKVLSRTASLELYELARVGLWAQERVMPLLRLLPPLIFLRKTFSREKKEWVEIAVAKDNQGLILVSTVEHEVGRAFEDYPRS